MAARPAYVVLEYDGPAFRRWLEAAEAQPGSTDDPPGSARVSASRLVPVDVGRDAGELRRLYPDRSRDLIVPAIVRPRWTCPDECEGDRAGKAVLSVRIQSLLVREIHVPKDLAAPPRGAPGGGASAAPAPPRPAALRGPAPVRRAPRAVGGRGPPHGAVSFAVWPLRPVVSKAATRTGARRPGSGRGPRGSSCSARCRPWCSAGRSPGSRGWQRTWPSTTARPGRGDPVAQARDLPVQPGQLALPEDVHELATRRRGRGPRPSPRRAPGPRPGPRPRPARPARGASARACSPGARRRSGSRTTGCPGCPGCSSDRTRSGGPSRRRRPGRGGCPAGRGARCGSSRRG